MKFRPLSKAAAAITAASLVGSALLVPVWGQSSVILHTPDASAHSIHLQSIGMLDQNGASVEMDPAFPDDLQQLLENCEPGEMMARKRGAFASVQDAASGIAHLGFQTAGKEAEVSQPVQVMLIVDQSGSMNMYHKNVAVDDRMCCLNPDHYYYIPENLLGNTYGGYVRIADFNDEGPQYAQWYAAAQNSWHPVRWVVNMLSALDAAGEAAAQGELVIARPQEAIDPAHLYEPVLDEDCPYFFYDNSTAFLRPDSNHYKLVDGQMVKITPYKHTPGDVSDPLHDGYYYSPPFGLECYDRAVLSKLYLQAFTQSLLETNPQNKVGMVLFHKDCPQSFQVPLTSDLQDLEEVLNCTYGGGGTNYELGFVSASRLLEKADFSRPLYTVFITDGMPNMSIRSFSGSEIPDGFERGAEYAGYLAAQEYKEAWGPLFVTGLSTHMDAYLQSLASQPDMAEDCRSMESFQQRLQAIFQEVTSLAPRQGQIMDTIADGFSLLVDALHPLSLNETAYTSLDQLPECIQIDRQNVTWKFDTVLEEGQSLDFYVQADSSLLDQSDQDLLLPTNTRADLRYFSAREAAGKQQPESSETEEEEKQPSGYLSELVSISPQGYTVKVMASPQMYVRNSLLTGTKQVDLEENQKARPGMTLTYTLQFKNKGTVDLDRLYVKDPLPQGLEYVENSGGVKADDGSVGFLLENIQPNSTQTVTFQAKITAEEGTIANTAYFGRDPGNLQVPTNEVVREIEPDLPDPDNPDPQDPEEGETPPDPQHTKNLPVAGNPAPSTSTTVTPAAVITATPASSTTSNPLKNGSTVPTSANAQAGFWLALLAGSCSLLAGLIFCWRKQSQKKNNSIQDYFLF